MQKAPRIPNRAPLAPPPLMKISGMMRLFFVNIVVKCCAYPDSTPVARKKAPTCAALPSNRRE